MIRVMMTAIVTAIVRDDDCKLLLQLCGDSNCAIMLWGCGTQQNSTIAVTSGP